MRLTGILTAIICFGLVFAAAQTRPAFAEATPHPAVQYWGLVVAGSTGSDDSANYDFDGQSYEVYTMLKSHGYASVPKHLYFISFANHSERDASLSKGAVQYGITTWLHDRSDSNDVVFIYLIDHGNFDQDMWYFFAGSRNPSDRISATELGDWISTLNYGRLFVVVEACFCGFLVPVLSASNRIIVTSTDAIHPAAGLGTGRALFSCKFFLYLDAPYTVGGAYGAFNQAANDIAELRITTENSSMYCITQIPLLEDDGDGVGVELAPGNTQSYFVPWVPGDVNNDNRVDSSDSSIVSAAFGSRPGSPNWNPLADLNGDLKVNMYDIAMVSKNIGYHMDP